MSVEIKPDGKPVALSQTRCYGVHTPAGVLFFSAYSNEGKLIRLGWWFETFAFRAVEGLEPPYTGPVKWWRPKSWPPVTFGKDFDGHWNWTPYPGPQP